MSFPKQTKSALRTNTGASLGQQVLKGAEGAKFLEPGEHEVRVKMVDRNKLAENKLTITYEKGGLEHNDMIYWLEQNEKTSEWSLSRRARNTLAALLPDKDALDAFFAEVDRDNVEVLDLLTGLNCKLVLKLGKGYVIDREQDANGYYYSAKDSQSGEPIQQSDDINTLKDWLKDQGLKRAYTNVWTYIATDGPGNVSKFAAGLKVLQEPKAGPGMFAQKKPVTRDTIPF